MKTEKGVAIQAPCWGLTRDGVVRFITPRLSATNTEYRIFGFSPYRGSNACTLDGRYCNWSQDAAPDIMATLKIEDGLIPANHEDWPKPEDFYEQPTMQLAGLHVMIANLADEIKRIEAVIESMRRQGVK